MVTLDRHLQQERTAKYPGIRVTTNGNQLVSLYTQARVCDAGIYYPITASTEMGEMFEFSFARGELNVFGNAKIAIEAEGEHAAQGGAIAYSLTGKRVVNFTSGQGVVYGIEQYYHAPPKFSTMILEVAARALTKHSLNVHCGHDDVYSAIDTGWIILFGKDAQQAADQSLILRKVAELALNPGINAQDGFLTSHLERTFLMAESALIREFLGAPDDIIDTPTAAQREIFGPKRRRVPEMLDLKSPNLIGSVQNQEHYMQGIAARRNYFVEPILEFLEYAYEEFGRLTGRHYGLISEYNTEDADTIFVGMGSACENIEAAVDYLKTTRGVDVGVIHVNCLRPFPEAALIRALAGKKNVIVMERTDEPMSSDNPLARDLRTALYKAMTNEGHKAYADLPSITPDEVPRVFSCSYGLGSRDFRPEGILGAYEFATGQIARQDGKTAQEGASFFYVGVDHPYGVVSEDRPSLLPEGSIAVRFHSIGGWGAITTGKNLGEIFGQLGNYIAERDFGDEGKSGAAKEVLHVSANPKYGSEKKGAPTNYFLAVAPERIRVNCDLHHVNVVICCDPKAFTHTNPLYGLEEGGALIWESNETDTARIWEQIPIDRRREILDKNIRVYALPGFEIAAAATDREDLQYRMQGNAFLGAFFKVSTFLQEYHIPDEEFLRIVEAQYNKKFGKFGEAVVQSNMTVMKEGFSRVREVPYGELHAEDHSTMRGPVYLPLLGDIPERFKPSERAASREFATVASKSAYDAEFRSGKGYNQPATTLMATGVMAAATGADMSKYVARRLKPIYHPEKCTQCMACITACPDTALPNASQEIATVLSTLFMNYVTSPTVRKGLLESVKDLEAGIHQEMTAESQKKEGFKPFTDIALEQIKNFSAQKFAGMNGELTKSLQEIETVLPLLPFGYAKVNPTFKNIERKSPGEGGVFSIFVSDLCKGCGECVVECGDHMALEMVEETAEINADHLTGIAFMDLLPDTPKKFLGLYDPEHPEESKAALLHNHLMLRSVYDSLVSGDGACAGCGEKSILRAVATLTEAFMRPLYHAKAARLEEKANRIEKQGLAVLNRFEEEHPEAYGVFRRSILHSLMGLGGEDQKATQARIEKEFEGTNEDLLKALVLVLRQDAFNHRDLQTIEGRAHNGMCAMAMAASTGCNTVYGSTHPSNPHPYPWMNSLFQDGPTIGWLVAESFILNHSRRSVIPERLADRLLGGFENPVTEDDYWDFTHFSDTLMTDREIAELPKVWTVGGDGALGDIGFQNLSKAVTQNRPNLKIVMLDTQVYSNTGGQNSDSTPMLGGSDMNQFGAASQGKLIEKKGVAEAMLSGHGSPFVAQVSMANAANLYRAILDGLTYRGTAFVQCYTSCQPEHGVADSMSAKQARAVRDSRGMPEFICDPRLGETYQDSLTLKGNPQPQRDWYEKPLKGNKEKYSYTVAHWAYTEARFRRHFGKVPEDFKESMIPLEEILWRITQDDVVNRRFLDKNHRSFIPKFGVYTYVEGANGLMKPVSMSRQMVLFCVERRKNWRLLQGRAGIASADYAAQKRLLQDFDAGKIPSEKFFSGEIQALVAEYAKVKAGAAPAAAPASDD